MTYLRMFLKYLQALLPAGRVIYQEPTAESAGSQQGEEAVVAAPSSKNIAVRRIAPTAAQNDRQGSKESESSGEIYAALTSQDQYLVREYFRLSYEVQKLIATARLQGKVFTADSVLTRFGAIERQYHGLGLLPVLPSAVDRDTAGDINLAINRGLISRRLHGGDVSVLCPGIIRYVDRLDARFQKTRSSR